MVEYGVALLPLPALCPQVTIHPDYVKNVRDQADIALVKLDRNVKFALGKIAPICLPSKHGG